MIKIPTSSESCTMKEPYINTVVADIQKNCEYLLTSDQLETIRQALVTYAVAALMDSSVRKEIDQICKEEFTT